MFLIAAKLTAPPGVQIPVIIQQQPLNNYEAIWQAVCQVESNCNPWAVNYEKGGFSCGISQIRQCRIDHYNQLSTNCVQLDDVFDPEISKEIFMFFAHRIGNEDKLIKAWNGAGEQTYHYLSKVRRIME